MENETPTPEPFQRLQASVMLPGSDSPDSDSPARRARLWRQSNRWTQVSMAEELGIATSTVGRVERGHRTGHRTFVAYLRLTGIYLWPASSSQGDAS